MSDENNVAISSVKIQSILEKWCDENISLGKTYAPSKPENKDENLIFIYQDNTACSASYAFVDVFKRKTDNKYIIKSRIGFATFHGEDPGTNEVSDEIDRDNILQVMDYLLDMCFHDSNNVGDMVYKIPENIMKNIPMRCDHKNHHGSKNIAWDKCNDNNTDLINYIENLLKKENENISENENIDEISIDEIKELHNSKSKYYELMKDLSKVVKFTLKCNNKTINLDDISKNLNFEDENENIMANTVIFDNCEFKPSLGSLLGCVPFTANAFYMINLCRKIVPKWFDRKWKIDELQ